ncbi:MAG: hypothetical protein KJZ86_06135 [Caldilineaceae bacterium]|nr:hypothetical protein [Caldilineaceae bacterium]
MRTLHSTIWFVVGIALLLMSSGVALSAPPTAEGDVWDDRFGLPTVEYGSVRALASDGENLYAAGNFTAAGLLPANNVARWDGRRWHALGSGVNGYVYALAVYKGALYAGGEFTQAGDVAVNSLAVWDGKKWSGLGQGPGALQGTYKGVVRALAVVDDALYIGGDFTSLDNLATLDIARWDGRKLSALGSGLGNADYSGTAMDSYGYGSVYALAGGPDGSLYAGGDFSHAGNDQPLPVNSIARWDGQEWTPLGSGLEKTYGKGEVRALAVDDSGILFAGGQFGKAGGEVAASIAQWDGQRWRPVGSGLGTDSAYAYINALAVVGDSLYAGGGMTSIGGKKVAGLALWDGWAWAGVGDGMRDSYDGVLVLLSDGNGGVYAAGSFTGGGKIYSRNLIRWTGAAWEALGQGMGYGTTSGRVEAVTVDPAGLVYAGGYFDSVGGQPVQNIAVWNGNRWAGLGQGVNGSVYALATYGTKVYVGGGFTEAGGQGASYIAQYDSVTARWSALASGVNGYVYALAVAGDGTLFVGGDFTGAGDADAQYIARWDGKRWSGLGKGIEPYSGVRALAWDGRNLVLGGSFATVKEGDEQVKVNGLLLWDSQTDDRYTVGTGNSVGVTRKGSYGDFSGEVYALALTEKALYVGGLFDRAGGVAARSVAAYDFQKGWQALGDSVSNAYTPYVYALAAGPDGIYAGGDFTAAGAAQTPSLAHWDEMWQRWEALDGGLSSGAVVKVLTVGDGSLYVGGQFSAAGGAPAAAFARWGQPVTIPVVRPQIRGGNSRVTPTPAPTAAPTPCPTRKATGAGVTGQSAPCGGPTRR